MTITELLATVKDRTGLPDAAIARVVGVRPATFTRWRTGNVAVGPVHAARLAALTGLPVGDVAAMLAGQTAPAPTAVGDGTVASLIVEWQDETDLDNVRAAEACGTTLSMFLRWRKGLVIPSAPALAGLADVIGVDLETMVMAAYRSALAKVGGQKPS